MIICWTFSPVALHETMTVLTRPPGIVSVATVICLTFAGGYIIFKSTRNTYNSPPGPRSLPILGNALDLPLDHPWYTFSSLRKKYGTWQRYIQIYIAIPTAWWLGDIVALSVLGNRIVVLNSRKVINDLLVERGAIYSDRPPFALGKWYTAYYHTESRQPKLLTCLDSFGFHWFTFACQNGEELQRQRKMMAQCLGPSTHKRYLPGALRSAQEMCLQIAESPKQWKNWVKL
jgi:hypothetical protein